MNAHYLCGIIYEPLSCVYIFVVVVVVVVVV